jgi:hypothetical protein
MHIIIQKSTLIIITMIDDDILNDLNDLDEDDVI